MRFKKAGLMVLLIIPAVAGYSQSRELDSLRGASLFAHADSLLENNLYDSSIACFNQAAALYRPYALYLQRAACYNKISGCYWRLGQYDESEPAAQRALQLANRARGPNLEQALAYENLAIIRDDNGHFNEAYAYYRKALQLKLALPGNNEREISGTYNNLGIFFNNKEQYDSALVYMQRAMTLRRRLYGDESSQVASSLNNIGTVYQSLAQYQQALDYFRKGLAIRLKTLPEDHSEIGVSYNNIGLSAQSLGYFQEAIDAYRQCERIYLLRFGPDHKYVASLYLNLSALYYLMGDYRQASEYALKALPIQRRTYGENSLGVANVYVKLGAVNLDEGQFDLGLQYHQKALDIERAVLGDDNLAVAIQWMNTGVGYLYGHDLKKALDYFFHALQIQLRRGGAKYQELGRTYNNIGQTYLEMGNFALALEYYRKSLQNKIASFGPAHPLVASAYQGLADTYSRMGDYRQATDYFSKGSRLYTQLFQGKYPELADLYNMESKMYRKQQAWDRALHASQMALISNVTSFNDTSLAANPDLKHVLNAAMLLQSLSLKGNLLCQRFLSQGDSRDLKLALHSLGLADSLVQLLRTRPLNMNDQILLSEQARETYAAAIRVCYLLQQKDPSANFTEKAFYYSEQSKSTVLLKALANASALEYAGIPESTLQLESTLKIYRAYYESALAKASQDLADSDQQVVLRSHLFEINRRYDSLIHEFEINYPRYYQLKYHKDQASLEEVASRLPDSKTGMISYFSSENRCYIFLITRNHTFFRESISPEHPDSLFTAFRNSLSGKSLLSNAGDEWNQFCQNSSALYHWLLMPVEHELETLHNLVIIPDGNMALLPFGALLTGNQGNMRTGYASLPFLLKRFAIGYAYSASLWQSRIAGTRNWPFRYGGFAPFQASAAVPAGMTAQHGDVRNQPDFLPFTSREVEAAAGYLGGRTFLGNSATEACFKREAGQFQILHLAMHAQVNDSDPLHSRFLFAPGNDSLQDGFLNAYELYNMNIPADLAVLSACNTGYGQLARGEGIMSLSRAFSYAGCNSLVMSLWPADDRSTAAIIRSFYKYLSAGDPKDEALRKAKLDYLQSADPLTSHPYFWATFIANGDMAPLPKGRWATGWWLWSGMLVALTALFFYFRFRRRKNPGNRKLLID